MDVRNYENEILEFKEFEACSCTHKINSKIFIPLHEVSVLSFKKSTYIYYKNYMYIFGTKVIFISFSVICTRCRFRMIFHRNESQKMYKILIKSFLCDK